jgi:uncharacterized membrane protein
MRFLYHPLIVHFPIALWLTSLLFDVLYLGSGDRFYERGARLLIGLGLLGAAVAIITGFVDFRPLVAEGIGQSFVDRHRVHALSAYGATLAYLASFVVRLRPKPNRAAIVILALLGAGFISAAGYIGGDVRAAM